MIDSSKMTQRRLLNQLWELGVPRDSTLLVHTSFSRVGPVVDGPVGLIEALAYYVGPMGTLVMPSMADDDDELFDPARSPCRKLGVVPDTFWRLPRVRRSDNPHAFAARGPGALEVTQPHPVDVPHGLDSPVGRVLAQDGYILLLGVDHDANTMVHLAENLAGVTYGVPKYSLLAEGRDARRVEYMEPTHCCDGFRKLNPALDLRQTQRMGPVGNATARLVRAVDVVEAALTLLKTQEDVFLHEKGRCAECDEARGGMVSSAAVAQLAAKSAGAIIG